MKGARPMPKTGGKLNGKEKLFCAYFASQRNAKEAAVKAGYKHNPEYSAVKLLRRENVRGEILSLSQMDGEMDGEVLAGYKRLAFGNVTDAVGLLFMPEELGKYDLMDMDFFNVSDIKRAKGGGMEIKFFDRQKALDALHQLEKTTRRPGALPFYQALENSAKNP